MAGLNLTLSIWRQASAEANGQMKTYQLEGINPHCSFLEMLDVLNETILTDPKYAGDEPVAFDFDCREGICGSCGVVVNGIPHGPVPGITICQLHMRYFEENRINSITIEPWRADAFPIIKDLVVDRGAFDRIVEAGGYVTVDTGSAADANEMPIPKPLADQAFDMAACIGCGACVASCKNASASLFVGAKVTQLALLPQGHHERATRVVAMVQKMDELGFGACTNEGECEAVCPKSISTRAITTMNKEYLRSFWKNL